MPAPHLFGHRGASGECPENTLLAFERALAQGVPFLETDCQETADGEVVAFHDERLERTTDGRGPLGARTLRELRALDAGYRFSPDGGASFPFRGHGLRVPRLAELLERFPDARLNVELKRGGPGFAERVVGLVREHRAEPRVLLTAARGSLLDEIRALRPGTALGCSTEDALAFFAALQGGPLEPAAGRADALQIPPSFQGRPLVTPESVEAAHRIGLAVHVWTINDEAEIRRLLGLGVDGLMSDFPARLVAAAGAR